MVKTKFAIIAIQFTRSYITKSHAKILTQPVALFVAMNLTDGTRHDTQVLH